MSNDVAVRMWDVFELPGHMFKTDGPIEPTPLTTLNGKMHIGLFMWSQDPNFKAKEVTTACGAIIKWPWMLRTTGFKTNTSLGSALLAKTVPCERCRRKYPDLMDKVDTMRKRLFDQINEESEKTVQLMYERERTEHFKLQMNELIETGIAEFIETPLKELEFGDRTVRDLLEAFHNVRWVHADLIQHAEYYGHKQIKTTDVGVIGTADLSSNLAANFGRRNAGL
jgi:hypothetical protein